MIISMIAAMGNNRVIGKGNKMMWRLPAEWEYFKSTTLGHCIITGRKNFEAQGRALPGRTNIIVTRNTELKIEGCVVVHSIEAALDYARESGETEAFICGGGQIYKESINMAHKIYLTSVDFTDEGEVFFPEFDESLYTKETKQEMAASETNKYAWSANLFTKI
jgi:dihydrofolate reductase